VAVPNVSSFSASRCAICETSSSRTNALILGTAAAVTLSIAAWAFGLTLLALPAYAWSLPNGGPAFGDIVLHTRAELTLSALVGVLVLLAAQFGDPQDPRVVPGAVAIELTHLATLYHDDVMDEAQVRRGAPSANLRWSNNVAILAGDYLFATASRLVSRLGPDAVRIIAETFAQLVTGQMRETQGAADKADPIAHYLKVVHEKTACLIGAAGRFGAMFSGADDEQIERLSRLGDLVGTAFQISDDIIDIDSDPDESGKLPGTDLREGVHTLPVLYALDDTGPDADRLRQLLAGPIDNDAAVTEALTLLRASAGMAKAKATVAQYAAKAREEMAALPDSPGRQALTTLVDYTIHRHG